MHYCLAIRSGILFITLFVSSQIRFEFSLSTSLSCAFGLQETQVTRTPSRQPRLELQIRVRVKWGQRLCAGRWQSLSVEALWGSWRAASCLSLTAILLALRAQLQVTALTGFVPALLGKIRPLPYKKTNMSDWAVYVSGVINSTYVRAAITSGKIKALLPQ